MITSSTLEDRLLPPENYFIVDGAKVEWKQPDPPWFSAYYQRKGSFVRTHVATFEGAEAYNEAVKACFIDLDLRTEKELDAITF